MATLTTSYQKIAETSGTLNGNTCNVRIYAKYNSQSTTNNTSSVSYQSRLYYGGGYFFTGNTTTKSISGTGATSSSADGYGTYNNGETVLQTITGTVTHNNDGTKSVSMSATFYSSPWGYNVTASGTATLPQIKRYAVTNSVSGSDIEQNFSVNYTKYVSSYKYKLRISIPSVQTLETIDYNTSGTTFTLSQESINTLFNYFNEKSKLNSDGTFNLGFRVETWNNAGTSRLSEGNEKRISCKITNADPVFSNCEFKDVNITTLALTGNNQNIIKGYSNVQITISTANKAVAQKGATMVKYRFICGENEPVEADYSDNSDVELTISGVTSGTYTLYAIDSRGNNTPVTKLANQEISYSPLTIDTQNSNVERNNGQVGTSAILSYYGTIWNNSFGSVTNSVQSAVYQFKEVDSNTWITGTTNITPTLSNNDYSFSNTVRSNASDYSFDVNKSYNFKVTISDYLSSVSMEFTMSSGIPNISLNQNGVGIMCDYDENLGGDLQISGERFDEMFGYTYSTTEQLTTKKWTDDKPIYRIIITKGLTSGSSRAEDTVSITNLNYDTITSMKGIAYASGYVRHIPYAYCTSGTTLSEWAALYVRHSDKKLICTHAGTTLGTLYVILEYTKTSS